MKPAGSVKQNGACATVMLAGAHAGTPGAVLVRLGAADVVADGRRPTSWSCRAACRRRRHRGRVAAHRRADDCRLDDADVDGRGRRRAARAPGRRQPRRRGPPAPRTVTAQRMRPLSQAAGTSRTSPRARRDPVARRGTPIGMTDPAAYPIRRTQSDRRASPAPGHAPPADRAKKRSFSIGQLLAAILFVLVVIFIVENTDERQDPHHRRPEGERPGLRRAAHRRGRRRADLRAAPLPPQAPPATLTRGRAA